MTRLFLAAVLAFSTFSLAAPSLAAAQSEARGLRAQAKNKRKPVKKFDFTGDDIEATQVRPDGDDMITRMFATHANLVRIRQSFTKEILKATEDI